MRRSPVGRNRPQSRPFLRSEKGTLSTERKMRKVNLNGAVMRNKLRGALVHSIARMPLSTEPTEARSDPSHLLDVLILRAREINATAAKGETL